MNKKTFFSAVIGNILEWYDFTLYAYFASVFARAYFPSDDPFVSLLNVYGLFAVGYIMRPIGALTFGYMGDKYGKQASLMYSITLMGLCSLGMALLPTYETIGIWASILLALIRLLQGFAVGGEYSGATLVLIDNAPTKQETFYGSLGLASAYSGFVVSALVAAILGYVFTPTALLAYGWRLGFLLGASLAVLGLYLRQQTRHSQPNHIPPKTKKVKDNPIRLLFTVHRRFLLLAMGISLLPAGLSYMIFVYMSEFLTQYAHYPSEEILWINVFVMIVAVLCIPLIGWIADTVGRRLLMLVASITILMVSVPLFGLLITHALFGMLLFTLLNALYEANIPTEVAFLFSKEDRYSGLAFTLNLTNGIAGGLAPMIATLLIHHTHHLSSPMYYIVGLSLVASLTLFYLLAKKG
jgi:MHS family proline/betaine transporter-like MFS transporter